MNNEELVLETIVSTPDGSGLATKGKELEQKWNSNASKTALNINAIWLAIAECIVSSNIVSIRINNTTNKAEYTFDSKEDIDEGTAVWYLLSTPEWKDIQGNPMGNTALAALLNSKASAATVEELQALVTVIENSVASNTANIEQNRNDISDHDSRLDTIDGDIAQIGEELANTVKSNPGDFLMLKWNQDTNNVDFSVDGGYTYKPIMSSIMWEDLVGLPDSNIEFRTFITGLVGDMYLDPEFESIHSTVWKWVHDLEMYTDSELEKKTPLSTFYDHSNNTSNPHGVTKDQLGLDQVENISPKDMPISDAVQAVFDSMEAKDITFGGITGFNVLDKTSYDNLVYSQNIESKSIYLVSRHNTQQVSIEYRAILVTINNTGIGYSVGDKLDLKLGNKDLEVEVTIVNSDGSVAKIDMITNGSSVEDFAGIGIPMEGGTGTGVTVDIVTEMV